MAAEDVEEPRRLAAEMYGMLLDTEGPCDCLEPTESDGAYPSELSLRLYG